MSAFLSPIGGAGWQFFTNQGVIAAGGFLYTYIAGSTTPQATWAGPDQSVQNTNPIVLNSYGRPPNEIWLANGVAYKFVITDASGNALTPSSYDNIVGVNSTTLNQSEWVANAVVPTYVSNTQFTLPGNQTATYPTNQRIQYFLASGTFYGYVTNSAFNSGTGLTTISIAADTTPLDNTLSGVSYSILNATHPSVPQQFVQQGQAINGSPIGTTNPSTAVFTTLASSNVNITGGTITGITGFSVPDFLFINQGVS